MSLGALDVAVIIGYFIAVIAIGLWAGRREKNTTDFFLGGRKQHWLLAGISIIATEVSAVTYVSVPADSFRSDCNYLQMYVGSFVGRILIVFLLLPAFYGGSVTTVYEYLGQRFGPLTRTTASIIFLASRVIASGLRLLIGSSALAIVFDWPLHWVVIISAGISVLYATYGGIKAILWTDLLQTILFVGAAIAVVVYIFHATPGTPTETITQLHTDGKLKVFTFDWYLNNDKSFYVLFVHTVFLNMASMGCDQDLTQRMLTCANLRQGQRSLLFNAFAGFPIVCLFLLIGVLLYVYSQTVHGGVIPPMVQEKTDRVFPHFIANDLPRNVGFRGLLVTAILAASMSTLASAVGALASSAVTDLYRPLRKALQYGVARSSRSLAVESAANDCDHSSFMPNDETHMVFVARLMSVLFGGILVIVALSFSGNDKLLWEVFKWPSLVVGSLLGVFLLGVLTRDRGQDGWNVFAMLLSISLVIAIKLIQDSTGKVYIAWPWWVVVGTIWTAGLGLFFKTPPASLRR